MFLLENFDTNIFDNFKYLYIGFKRKGYFYKKRVKTFYQIYDQKKDGGLDFCNWVFNAPFNPIFM